jgi:hypothetical protein
MSTTAKKPALSDVDRELLDACKRGLPTEAQSAIYRKANVTCVDEQGLTPLQHAVRGAIAAKKQKEKTKE